METCVSILPKKGVLGPAKGLRLGMILCPLLLLLSLHPLASCYSPSLCCRRGFWCMWNAGIGERMLVSHAVPITPWMQVTMEQMKSLE